MNLASSVLFYLSWIKKTSIGLPDPRPR